MSFRKEILWSTLFYLIMILISNYNRQTMVFAKKLNPSVDIVFKKLFGVDRNKDILMAFINSFIGKEHQLKDLQVINKYNLMHFLIDKLDLLEIEGTGVNHKRYRINIKLKENGTSYDRQGLEDWSTKFSNRIEEGIDFYDIYKGFSVHILTYNAINNAKYHNVFPVTEQTVGVMYFTDIELHTLELWKFNETYNGQTFDEVVEQIKCPLDMWMMFLTKQCLMDTSYFPPQLKDKMFEKAMCELEAMPMDVEEMHVYDRHQNFLMPY